jgi:hypothetical protein
MKKLLILLVATLMLSSCATQRFYIGDTKGETFSQSKTKSIWIIGGLIPIINKHPVPNQANAKGYIITTKYNVLDVLISGLTGGIVITRNIKYEAIK